MTKNMKKIFLGMLLMFGAHSAQASLDASGTLSGSEMSGLSSAPTTTGATTSERVGVGVGTGVSYLAKGLTHRHARLLYLIVVWRLDNAWQHLEKIEQENNAEWTALIGTERFLKYDEKAHKNRIKFWYCLNEATGGMTGRFSAVGGMPSAIMNSFVSGIMKTWIGMKSGLSWLSGGITSRCSSLSLGISTRGLIKSALFALFIASNNWDDVKGVSSAVANFSKGLLKRK